jgi:arylsulfatase A-like enzyme
MNPPNILFILADDLGWADLSLHGSPIRTPTIDRLASEGVELEQHYVCPMCTPTRVSLLTGRHPGRFGAHATVPSNAPVLPNGYETLATVLRNRGYDTGLFGKWHLGSTPEFGPNNYGFNTSYGSLAGGVDPYNHRYKRGDFSVTWHRDGELVAEKGHVTDLIVNEAIGWIESRNQPWFCYVPFTAVHVPVKPVQSWIDRYQFEHFDEDYAKDTSFRKYAAYTSHMDEGIGELLEALERIYQRENTIVIFASDNGAINDCPIHGTDLYPGWQEAYPRLGSNLPFRGVKAQMYEGGIRTPTVVNWRGQLSPAKMPHPVHMVDWMPTFSRLVDAEPQTEPQWDGTDIWPLVSGREASDNNRVFYWNFKGSAELGIRHGDWKLIRRQANGQIEIELYNIAEDPYESSDRASDEPQLAKDLSDLIEEQRKLDDTSKRADVDSPMMN